MKGVLIVKNIKDLAMKLTAEGFFDEPNSLVRTCPFSTKNNLKSEEQSKLFSSRKFTWLKVFLQCDYID